MNEGIYLTPEDALYEALQGLYAIDTDLTQKIATLQESMNELLEKRSALRSTCVTFAVWMRERNLRPPLAPAGFAEG